MYSFGYFPGVWLKLQYANVSEHTISSIFKGWMWAFEECSETSAYCNFNQTPGKYPKEYIHLDSEYFVAQKFVNFEVHYKVILLLLPCETKYMYHILWTLRNPSFRGNLYGRQISLFSREISTVLSPRKYNRYKQYMIKYILERCLSLKHSIKWNAIVFEWALRFCVNVAPLWYQYIDTWRTLQCIVHCVCVCVYLCDICFQIM